MSSSDLAIKVEHLSKTYLIYDHPADRLKQFIYPRLQRLIGKHPETYYHEFWAVRDVSFEVKKGETVGIIGRNGSGKSTLLQLICGTLNPSGGSVQTSGRIAALLELGSGFNPEFTGRENVYMNGAILGLSTEEIDARFDDIAAFADIGEFIEQPIKTYSSGMAVRLAFSVQSMIDPDILIVDEALAVGDEKFQRKCFARLEELKSRGTAILFVSHSGPAIVELCDCALLLENGTRLMYSRPLQTVRAYQRLLYAPTEQHDMMVQKYRAADQSGANLDISELTAVVADLGEARTTELSAVGTTNPEMPEPGTDPDTGNQEDFFDPGLVPETTTVYPLQGAEILSFQILGLDERPVNVLLPGKEYRFEVSGRILSDRDGIYFGVHIRSISGAVITGQVYPEQGKYIKKVLAGQNFRIRYGFKMDLLPGVYFVGGGVWSCYEPACLHRIMDAAMFRVQDKSTQFSFGVSDLLSSPASVELF